MSQNFPITRVRHRGAPVYLGEVDGVDTWSSNPERIIEWMCDGWRSRFNQHRGCRATYAFETTADGTREVVRDSNGDIILLPLGERVGDFVKDSAARRKCSWLRAMPSMVLQSAERIENTEWWAATKRRRTLRSKGHAGGRMPGFKSRKHEQRFVSWSANNGFTVQRTGRKSGVLVFTGRTPKDKANGGPCTWHIVIGFRMSEDVRHSTSVQVDWMHKRLTFVNEPLPRTHPTTGKSVGIDRGIAHALALSTGTFIDVPDTSAIERRHTAHQRAMNRSREQAQREGRNFWESRRYQEHKRLAAKHSATIANTRRDFAHKTSAMLVRDFDVIVFEDLHVQSMVKAPSPKPDPDNSGKYLPNGRAAKRANARGIMDSCWGNVVSMTQYKATLTPGRSVVLVPAPYTSQRCHLCGHTSSENRESQAVFVCKRCGWRGNADTNAALNIEADGLAGRTAPAQRTHQTTSPVGAMALSVEARTISLRGNPRP